MTFTIEPMINAGRPEIKHARDGWTIVTADHSLSAQWEHTVAVTDDGFEGADGVPGRTRAARIERQPIAPACDARGPSPGAVRRWRGGSRRGTRATLRAGLHGAPRHLWAPPFQGLGPRRRSRSRRLCGPSSARRPRPGARRRRRLRARPALTRTPTSTSCSFSRRSWTRSDRVVANGLSACCGTLVSRRR